MIRVKCFGPLRPFSSGGEIALEASAPLSVAELRARLTAAFSDDRARALVARSAIADGRAVLSEDAVVDTEAELALLPPVSGG